MSKKIPFLEMFAALTQWAEFVNAMEGWVITEASIDRSSRSAVVTVEGAAGAGPNLVVQAEETVARCYGLNSVKLNCITDKKEPERAEPAEAAPAEEQPQPDAGAGAPAAEEDAFARAEAIRAAALKKVRTAVPASGKGKGGGEKRGKGRAIYGKPIKRAPVPIGELELDMGMVVVEGDVFAVDHRELKKRGAWVTAFDITDYTGSIRINKFFPGDEGKILVDGVKKGMRLLVQGRLNMDRFYGDMVLEPVAVMAAEQHVRMDNAPEKRVELHLHTNMSAMDALTAVGFKTDSTIGTDKNVIKRAEAWGHPAIAITDHGVAHAFPNAKHSAKKIKVLFGVEAYYINDVDDRVVVHGQTDALFSDEIVCFDIETTGLNKKYEVIIEIGAVVLKNGEITDRFNTFVSPGRILSPEIIHLTGITDEMLEGAPSQKEALEAFLAFAGDRPLAAHNADFDMGFIAAGCRKYGIPFHNPSVDSLILAQNLLPELGKYKLDIVAEYLHLPAFNHHRASDDAATVAYMLPHFFKKLEEMGLRTLGEINPAMPKLRRGGGKLRRKPKHLIVLAKNQTGLRNLYKLISLSQLEHFKRYPIMPKSLINENREGLIIGSACEAGELFQAVVDGKDWDDLKRIASWYDYLEIQPLCNNMFMLRKGIVKSEEELRDFNRTIVRLGEEMGKPVCATGDVHFLDPEDEVYRHILLASKGFEDADESLPIYFKTTEEMLQEFAYLGKEKAREVVVTNTNLIADWCDPIDPLPQGLFAPKLEDSDGELKRLVWGKAHELYGENPPKLVTDRIEVELGDIIRCKYDVIYMSAQKLVQNSLEHGYLVGSRGSVGSSLVAFMSGITEVNSLPAHYRCPNCKHSDFDYARDPAHTYGCGADMPDAVCPVCGTKYVKAHRNC